MLQRVHASYISVYGCVLWKEGNNIKHLKIVTHQDDSEPA